MTETVQGMRVGLPDLINEKQLREICGKLPKNIGEFIPHLNYYMRQYDINTPMRIAAFIAQIAHESGRFIYVRELASGKAYEGRKDLGNTHKGDGVKFKGRGILQITGRANYKNASLALFNDLRLLTDPTILEQPQYAVASACWFWSAYKQLNDEADKGMFETITRRINGGVNGLKQRQELYEIAKQVLGA